MGQFITPPGPISTFDSPEVFSFGLNQGLGVPPFDTFYAYQTKATRRRLLRVSLSAVQPLSEKLKRRIFSDPGVFAKLAGWQPLRCLGATLKRWLASSPHE